VFSGIVEAIGTVVAVEPTAAGRRIRVRAPEVVGDLAVGGSVAVDGACLTAVEVHPDGFAVDVIGTTLSRTVAGTYVQGSRVNLERALKLGDRLDGHLVQGHVDGVGEVMSVVPRGELVLIDFTLPREVDEVTVLQGSITLNGVSLTVNALPAPGAAQVSIIPFTWDHTALADLRPGARVNLEGDMIGKYVRRLLDRPQGAGGGGAAPGADPAGAAGY